jgi:hypothetical protein
MPLAAALAEAAEIAKRPAAEQLALLPPSKFGPDTARHRVMREHVARHERGRPPGAQNLATRDVLAFVRQVLGDPVLERARWMRHTPDTLAAELGCTKLEAFDRLDRIRSELSKLFYAPLAPVDGDGNTVVPHFSMLIGGGQATPGVDLPPWAYLEQVEQKQPLAESSADVSHADVSHAEDK